MCISLFPKSIISGHILEICYSDNILRWVNYLYTMMVWRCSSYMTIFRCFLFLTGTEQICGKAPQADLNTVTHCFSLLQTRTHPATRQSNCLPCSSLIPPSLQWEVKANCEEEHLRTVYGIQTGGFTVWHSSSTELPKATWRCYRQRFDCEMLCWWLCEVL